MEENPSTAERASGAEPPVEEVAPQTNRAAHDDTGDARRYVPAGYCPRCAYAMDAGVCSECGFVSEKVDRHPGRRQFKDRIVRFAIAVLLLGGALWGGQFSIARYWSEDHLIALADGDSVLKAWAQRILDERWARRSRREQQETMRRRTAILAELEQLPMHPWAGIYTRVFPQMGTMLSLTPTSGYLGSDGGLSSPARRMFFDYGTVTEPRTDVLALRSEVDPIIDVKTFPELTLFWWDGRRCAVPTDQMLAFINAYNGGHRLPTECYFRMTFNGTNQAPTAFMPLSPPILPSPYDRFLHEQPLRARIRSLSLSSTPSDKQFVAGESRRVQTGSAVIELSRGDVSTFLGMKFYGRTKRGDELTATVREEAGVEVQVEVTITPPHKATDVTDGMTVQTEKPAKFRG